MIANAGELSNLFSHGLFSGTMPTDPSFHHKTYGMCSREIHARCRQVLHNGASSYLMQRSCGLMISGRPLKRIVALASVALGALSCGGGNHPQAPPLAPVGNVQLRVRVHVLQSDVVEALDATIGDDELHEMFAAVNTIWDLAQITWNIESVTRERAQSPEAFESLLRGTDANALEVLLSILPQENLLAGEWNVFVIRNLGNVAGGVYISFAEAQLILLGELGPNGPQEPSGSGPRILAHELGHSLGLQHVPCVAEGNLMAPGCRARDRTRLVDPQIAAARRQAAMGRPFVANGSVANRRDAR